MATHEASPFLFDRRTFGILAVPGSSTSRPLRFRRQRSNQSNDFSASATPPRFHVVVNTPSGTPAASPGLSGLPSPAATRPPNAVSIARRDGTTDRRNPNEHRGGARERERGRHGGERNRRDASRGPGGRRERPSRTQTPSAAPPRYSTLSAINDGNAVPAPSPPPPPPRPAAGRASSSARRRRGNHHQRHQGRSTSSSPPRERSPSPPLRRRPSAPAATSVPVPAGSPRNLRVQSTPPPPVPPLPAQAQTAPMPPPQLPPVIAGPPLVAPDMGNLPPILGDFKAPPERAPNSPPTNQLAAVNLQDHSSGQPRHLPHPPPVTNSTASAAVNAPPAPRQSQSYPPPQGAQPPNRAPPPAPQPPTAAPGPAPSAPPAAAAAAASPRHSLLSRPTRTQRIALDFDPWRDADLCLRSRDGTLIPCHGANLASASPLLAQLVGSSGSGAGEMPVTMGGDLEVRAGLPIFDFNEDGNVLLLMLAYVYPRPAPSLSSLRFGTVKALFGASRRYEVWRAIDASVAQLKALCPSQPFVVYAIAMAARQESLGPGGGKIALQACEALAKAASFHTLKHDLSTFNKSYFASLSGVAAHALWALHTNRLAQGKDIILSMPFVSEPGHAPTCPEHRLMERYWAEEARRVAEELKPELDMQRKVVIREPTGAGCLQCYRGLLRTAATVRTRWEKVPDTVAL